MDKNLFEYSKGRMYDETTALKIFCEVCKAVAFLHSKSLLHRDIKPENILLNKNGEIKLSDFGFSANFGFSESRNTMCGTKEYLPPEIIENKQQTEKVDIWCLGVLLYELLHRRVPFEGKNFEILLENIRRHHLNFKDGLNSETKNMINLCLKENPLDRPSASQLLANPIFQKINDGVKAIQISKPTASGSVPPRPDQHRNTQFLNAVYQNGSGNQHSDTHNVINFKQADSHKRAHHDSMGKKPFFNENASPVHRRPVTQEINRPVTHDPHALNSVIYKHSIQLQSSLNFAPPLSESHLDSTQQNLNLFNENFKQSLKQSNAKPGHKSLARTTDFDSQHNVNQSSFQVKPPNNNPTGTLLYRFNENQLPGQQYPQSPDVHSKLHTGQLNGPTHAIPTNSHQNSFVGHYQSVNDQRKPNANGKRDTSPIKTMNEFEATRLEELGSPTYRPPKRSEAQTNYLHFSYDFADKTPVNVSGTLSNVPHYYQVQTPRESSKLKSNSGKVPQLYKSRVRTPEVSMSRGFDPSTGQANLYNSSMHGNIQNSPGINHLVNSPNSSILHQSIAIKTNGQSMSPTPTANNPKFVKSINAQNIEQYTNQSFAKVKSHGDGRPNIGAEHIRSMTPNLYQPVNR